MAEGSAGAGRPGREAAERRRCASRGGVGAVRAEGAHGVLRRLEPSARVLHEQAGAAGGLQILQ